MRDRRAEFEAGRIATTGGAPRSFDAPAPDPAVKPNGQHPSYWVLSESERAKGFVRPVRRSYKHVGLLGPLYPLRDLTDEEKEQHGKYGYVKYEEYPESESPITGRYWTQEQLDKIGKGCGTVTTMGQAIAETYAREPGFYGSTMCCGCQKHLRVGADGEFVWMNERGSTAERVGT